jgi:hypothetical protein
VPSGRNRESKSRDAAGRRNYPEAVAQENERQKKVGLPDSTTVGMRNRPTSTYDAKKTVKNVRLDTAVAGRIA